MRRVTGLIIVVLYFTAASSCYSNEEEWRYTGQLHALIKDADRIVVRKGGYDCCGPVDKQTVLFEVKDRKEIQGVYEKLQFMADEAPGFCMCCGFPGIDWYKDGKRIVLSAVQHGGALRWKGAPGDVGLTGASSKWLIEWLAKNGVTRPKREREASERRARISEEGHTKLKAYVPKPFLEAVLRAEEETEEDDMFAGDDREGALRNRYVRAAYPDTASLYDSLFTLMACLPMTWDNRYRPSQEAAYDFIVEAPAKELDAAFRRAASSKSRLVRHGAARMVFSQHYMTIHGKTDEDVARWMALLVKSAYETPFPENRRLVLERLIEFSAVPATEVLASALEDPDQTVRRKAMKALTKRESEQSYALLQGAAAGKTKPREALPIPTDYGEGAPGYTTPGMGVDKSERTDQEYAKDMIQEMDYRRR
jgi:hypothetical protein